MSAFLLPGVEDNKLVLKIHISPCKTVDLAHPAHGLFNGPQGAQAPNVISIDPNDESRVYVGGQGYFFRSNDGGVNWEAIQIDTWGNEGIHEVSAITVNPKAGSVLYLGTHKRSLNSHVAKSVDYGKTWTWLNLNMTSDLIAAIDIDPINDSIVYLATSKEGVCKTINGGQTWSASNVGLTDLEVKTIFINKINPSGIYAGTKTGIFKSSDYGATWKNISNQIGEGPVDSIDGQFSSTDNVLIVTVAMDYTKYNDNYGIWLSTDGGGNWGKIATHVSYLDALIYMTANSVRLDPMNPCIIYNTVWMEGVYKSNNCGNSWSTVNEGMFNPWASRLAISKQDPSVLFCTTYGAGTILKTLNGGENWAESNNKLAYQRFDSVAFSPDGNWLYAGSAAAGIYRSSDRGNTWQLAKGMELADEIQEIIFNPNNPQIMYTVGFGMGVWKSMDGGINWTRVLDPRNITDPLNLWHIAIDPSNPSLLYIPGGKAGVYGSDDEGLTWQAKNKGLTGTYLMVVAVDPKNADTLLAGTHIYNQFTGESMSQYGIFRSTDRGESWTKVSGNIVTEGILDIVYDPKDINVVYASGTNAIYRSVDNGVSWVRLQNTFGGRRLFFDPIDKNIFYTVGGNFFIYKNDQLVKIISDGLGDGTQGAADPLHSGVFYAGSTRSGVLKMSLCP